MRMFHYVKMAQGVCCFLVLCFVLATVELRGRLIVKSENDAMLTKLLKSRNGPCDQLLLYIPPSSMRQRSTNSANNNSGRMMTRPERRNEEGISKLASNTDDNSHGNEANDSGSGRIVAVFDGSSVKTDERLNVTDELRLRAFLIFEWNPNDPTGINEPTRSPVYSTVAGSTSNLMNNTMWPSATKSSAKNVNQTGYFAGSNASIEASNDKRRNQGGSNTNGGGLLLPEGTHAFKISKRDGFNKGSSDSFNDVAGRLFQFVIVSLFQLVYTIAHLILKRNGKSSSNNKKGGRKNKKGGGKNSNGTYSCCELFFLLISLVLWVVLLFLAAGMCIYWEERWLCTNFRPELPSAFIWTSYLAAALILLFLVEACCCVLEAVDEESSRCPKKPQQSKNGTNQMPKQTTEDVDDEDQPDEFITITTTTCRPNSSSSSARNDCV